MSNKNKPYALWNDGFSRGYDKDDNPLYPPKCPCGGKLTLISVQKVVSRWELGKKGRVGRMLEEEDLEEEFFLNCAVCDKDYKDTD